MQLMATTINNNSTGMKLTTSGWRKWSAILDMLPSMLEAHETNIVFYLNRQIFRTFWAMKSHMTQWRW